MTGVMPRLYLRRRGAVECGRRCMMFMQYKYRGRPCFVAAHWAKGLVTIRFGTPRDWKGEKVVLFSELS